MNRFSSICSAIHASSDAAGTGLVALLMILDGSVEVGNGLIEQATGEIRVCPAEIAIAARRIALDRLVEIERGAIEPSPGDMSDATTAVGDGQIRRRLPASIERAGQERATGPDGASVRRTAFRARRG
jgi:hypothetical protein